MATTTTTPNMMLILPIPGVQSGPVYAININTALATIDSHTHVDGQGLPIPTAGINVNDDMAFNSQNATLLRSTRFDNQSMPLSLGTDLMCLYVSNGELYFNDIDGNQVQLTLDGVVDTSASGNISGMGGTNASVAYSNLGQLFTFSADVGVPANIKFGPLSIGRNIVGSNFVTLSGSASQIVDYSLTFAPSLPATQSLVGISNSGQLSNITPDSVTIAINGPVLEVPFGGIAFNQLATALFNALCPIGSVVAFTAATAPGGWFLCDGSAISRTTYSSLFAVIGIRYGQGNGSTTFNLPDFRGMFLRGVSGTSGRDPDAASRTASGVGGDAGNNIGSQQSYDIQSHNHSQNPHNHGITDPGHSHFYPSSDVPGTSVRGLIETTGNQANISSSITATGVSVDNFTAGNNATGGNETRPINIYVQYIIRY